MTKTLLTKRLQLMLAALLMALAVGGGFMLDDASAMPPEWIVCNGPGDCERAP